VVLPNNTIGLLDFGMTGRLDERLREEIEEMLLAIVRQDTQLLMSVIMRLGKCPISLDEGAFSNDLAEFVSHYSTQSLNKLNLGDALTEMIEMIRRYQIILPAQVAMLIKTLATLEGSGKLLSPNFSLMEVMQPFQRQMIMQRLSPKRQVRKLRRFYHELEHLAEILPRRIITITEQIQSGRFDVHLDHRGLGPSVNRLVLGMISSALFLGSSLMLSQRVPPLLFPQNPFWGLHELSLLGLIGMITSVMMGLRLIRSIYKTGHLDHKEK
jgi:ubiquinone biosynthesis protein